MRRFAFMAAAAGTASLLLAGCSSSGSPTLEYFKLLRQSLTGSFSDHGITRQQAAAVPYASLGYRVDDGHENLLVLATDTNGDLLWTARSHVVLLTRGGRIARSVGLPHNRASLAPQGSAELRPLSDALAAPYRTARLVDMPEIGGYGVPISCTTTARGRQTITIIGTAIDTTRVDESCRASTLGWSFTDSYWIDAGTGFVWHSIQHLAPNDSTVQIEVLRPPG